MPYLESVFPLWAFGFIQFAGILSAWLARASEGSRSQAYCQWLFFALLVIVGIVTVLAVSSGPRYWFAAGGSLGAMLLAAIWHVEAPTSRSPIQ